MGSQNQSKGSGPNRVIYDRTYYLTQLQKKNTVIFQEISKFKKEIEVINKDNVAYTGLEKQYNELINEVRKLEGELAMFNYIKGQNEKKK